MPTDLEKKKKKIFLIEKNISNVILSFIFPDNHNKIDILSQIEN
jgi:hypothetical protein